MKADYIKEIIKKYDEMPYKCILIDGTWGIGKTYAVKDALKENNNVCYLSVFGIKDVQQIFHETFYQLGLKDKKEIRKMLLRYLTLFRYYQKSRNCKNNYRVCNTRKRIVFRAYKNISKNSCDSYR